MAMNDYTTSLPGESLTFTLGDETVYARTVTSYSSGQPSNLEVFERYLSRGLNYKRQKAGDTPLQYDMVSEEIVDIMNRILEWHRASLAFGDAQVENSTIKDPGAPISLPQP